MVALLCIIMLPGTFVQSQASKLDAEGSVNREPNSFPDPQLPTSVKFTQEEKQSQRVAAKSLLKSLHEAIAKGEHKFVVAPGNYRFDSEVKQGIVLEGVKDLTITGTGATFWFDQEYGIHMRHCSNITLQGFVVDMDPLPFIQGRIDSVDYDKHTLDVTLEPGYSIPPESEWNKQHGAYFFNQHGRVMYYDMDGGPTSIEKIGENKIRLAKFGMIYGFGREAKPRSVIVGDRVVLIVEPRGIATQIAQSFSNHMTLQDITVYASTGFAFFECFGDGENVYRNCKIARRPGTNRLMADMADGLHSNMMRKGPLIEKCDFSACGDDLINIHGMMAMVVENNDRELIIASVLHRSIFADSYLHIYHAQDSEYSGEAIVQKLEPVNDAAHLEIAKHVIAQLRNMTDGGVRSFDGLDLVRVQVDRPLKCRPTDLVVTYDSCGDGVSYSSLTSLRNLFCSLDKLERVFQIPNEVKLEFAESSGLER